MKKSQLLGMSLLLGAAFAAGLGFDELVTRPLLAQGRGPGSQNPGGSRPGPPINTPPPTTLPSPDPTSSAPLVYEAGGGSGSASANGLIAVTGSYGVGTSVLYLIDAVNRQLAVYEARGGSESMRRLTLVGARRIDLDLQLEGYNDQSEFGYDALKRMFDDRRTGRGVTTDKGTTGLERR